MIEGSGISKELNKHLIEGVNPIVVCIGSHDDFEKLESQHPEHPQKLSNLFGLNNPKNVDWANGTYGAKYFAKSEGNDPITKYKKYVISSIDNSNKFSANLSVCISLIVSGIDKQTGENISFVTHQSYFNSKGFSEDLDKRLLAIKNRCKYGTIDAVIIGGASLGTGPDKIYLSDTKSLSETTQKVLNFKPVIINGPKTETSEYDDFFYDNEHRRVYLVRSIVNSHIGSFVASGADKDK